MKIFSSTELREGKEKEENQSMEVQKGWEIISIEIRNPGYGELRLVSVCLSENVLFFV